MSAFRWGQRPSENLWWAMQNRPGQPLNKYGCATVMTPMQLASLVGYRTPRPIIRALYTRWIRTDDYEERPPRKWREFGKALGVPGLQGCDWWLAPEAFRLRCAALTKPDPPKRRWWHIVKWPTCWRERRAALRRTLR